MPVNVSPPLSNILMDLDVRQLREILIEIISWDATGKDIFDTDYLFQDPIKVRLSSESGYTDRVVQFGPNWTRRIWKMDLGKIFSGNSRFDRSRIWWRCFPWMGRAKFNSSTKYFNNSKSCENSSCIEKTARSLPRFVISRITTYRMSCLSDCITHSVALQFIHAQKYFKNDSTNLKITLSLSLLFVHAKKHNQTQRFQSFLEGIFSTIQNKILQTVSYEMQLVLKSFFP